MKKLAIVLVATVALAACATTPKTQTCPDGSVIDAAVPCPPPPTATAPAATTAGHLPG